MLRSGGKTYVCDVNGFSFVKSSDNYYRDCAYQLRNIIYEKLNLKLGIKDSQPEGHSRSSLS